MRNWIVLSLFLPAVVSAHPPSLPAELESEIMPILVTKHKASAAVASVLYKGHIQTGFYGKTSYDSMQAVDATTYFRMGSVSKIFTALGILSLQESKVLSLDDTVRSHLPWFEVKGQKEISDKITIRHLLSHTSGLSREFGCLFSDIDGTWIPFVDPIACYTQREIHFEPGTDLKYSNLGFNILGAIIQRHQSQSLAIDQNLQAYAQFMRDRVFTPLQMPTAKFILAEDELALLAQPYGPIEPNTNRREAVVKAKTAYLNAPSYALALTTQDLPGILKLLRHVWKGEDSVLLKASTLRQMLDLRSKDKWSNYEYGLGLTIVPDASGRYLIGHTGGSPGYRVLLMYDSKNDLAVAVMANTHDNAARDIANVLFQYFSKTTDVVPPLKDSSPGLSEPETDIGGVYSGTYQMWARSFKITTIKEENGRPVLDILYDSKRRRLIPMPEQLNAYRIPSEGPYNDAKGEIIRFLPSQDENEMRLLLFNDGYLFKQTH